MLPRQARYSSNNLHLERLSMIVSFSVLDEESFQAFGVPRERRGGHQGQSVLQKNRLGEDREQRGPAAFQTQNRKHNH